MRRLKYILLTIIVLIGTIFVMPSIVNANWLEDGLKESASDDAINTGTLTRYLLNDSNNRDEYFEADANKFVNTSAKYYIKLGNDVDDFAPHNSHEICIDTTKGTKGTYLWVSHVVDVFLREDSYEINTYRCNGTPVNNKKMKNGRWDNPNANEEELNTFINVAIAAHLAGDTEGANDSVGKEGIYYGVQLMCQNYWLGDSSSSGVNGFSGTWGDAILAREKYDNYVKSEPFTSFNVPDEKVVHIRMLFLNGYFVAENGQKEDGSCEFCQNQLIYASREELPEQEETLTIKVHKQLIKDPNDDGEPGGNVMFGLFEETQEAINEDYYTKISRRDNYYLLKSPEDNNVYYVKKDGVLYRICDDTILTTAEYDGQDGENVKKGEAVFTIFYDPDKPYDQHDHYIVEEIGGERMAEYEWYSEEYNIDWGDENNRTNIEKVSKDSWEGKGVITLPPLYKSDVQEGVSSEQNIRAKGYYIYVKNKVKGKAKVTIEKRDKNRPTIRLKGAVFSIYKGDTRIAGPKETSDEGIVEFEIAEPGDDYIVREEQAPPGYKISEGDSDLGIGEKHLEIKPDYIETQHELTQIWKNEEESGAKITIIKKDINTGKKLYGAKFYLAFKDENGNFVPKTETLTTNRDGEAVFYVSEPGTYYAYETQPPSGYRAINNGTQSVSVTQSDIIGKKDKGSLTVYNDPGDTTITEPQYITILKQDEDPGTNEKGDPIRRKLPNTTFLISVDYEDEEDAEVWLEEKGILCWEIDNGYEDTGVTRTYTELYNMLIRRTNGLGVLYRVR